MKAKFKINNLIKRANNLQGDDASIVRQFSELWNKKHSEECQIGDVLEITNARENVIEFTAQVTHKEIEKDNNWYLESNWSFRG